MKLVLFAKENSRFSGQMSMRVGFSKMQFVLRRKVTTPYVMQTVIEQFMNSRRVRTNKSNDYA